MCYQNYFPFRNNPTDFPRKIVSLSHRIVLWAWGDHIFSLQRRTQFQIPGFIFFMMSTTLEDSELKCSCGLPAKMRVSRTSRNPFRLFYNCPKGFDDQCDFFWWSDEPYPTGDRHIDELNLIRNECIRLQERIDNLREEHDESRIQWNEEKMELTSQLLNVRTELDDIEKKIKVANELDLMPPLDKISIADKEADDAVVIHTVEQ